MKINKKIKVIVTSMINLSFACSGFASAVPGNKWDSPNKKSRDIQKWSSVFDIKRKDAEVTTNNDVAFAKKIQVIESAEKTLDLAYYIISDDHSSSYLVKKILEQGNKFPNLKVRILTDLHDGYNRLDYLTSLEKEYAKIVNGRGTGSLEVRFYNRPTENIMADAAYLTMPCPAANGSVSSGKECQTLKNQKIASAIKTKTDNYMPDLSFSMYQTLLSGIYSKNGDLIQLAAVKGQKIDVAALKAGGNATAEDKKNLANLLKTVLNSKIGPQNDRFEAKLKLAIAQSVYADQVNPILNVISEIIPEANILKGVRTANNPDSRAKDWDHITDFIHHKLILADGDSLVAGGRNIENSYHMLPNPLVHKYIFRDADISINLASANNELQRTYDRLWDFKQMVISSSDVRRLMPNDLLKNVDVLRKSQEVCQADPNAEACAQSYLAQNMKSLDVRESESIKSVFINASIYEKEYLKGRSLDLITQKARDAKEVLSIDENARISYFENLPFDKSSNKLSRKYGSESGKEDEFGKYIHALWVTALNSSCNPTQYQKLGENQDGGIFIQNAYFFPPAQILESIIKLGDQKCANQSLTVITNSFETTDLSPVNLVARSSLKAVVDYRNQLPAMKNTLPIDYREYKSSNKDDRRSLHAKVMTIGDDMFIGSANMDIRSYMMDTNNGFYIENAPELTDSYQAKVAELYDNEIKVASNQFVDSNGQPLSKDEFLSITQGLIQAGIEQRNVTASLSPEKKAAIYKFASDTFGNIYELTIRSIDQSNGQVKIEGIQLPTDRDQWLENPEAVDNFGGEAYVKEERNKAQNSLNNRFKVF